MRRTKLVLGVMAAAVGAAAAGAGSAGAADTGKVTPGKEALVELGRRLFMDPSASRLGRNSCASCHDPERGFSDPRAQSVDDTGLTRRHSQTLIDLAGEGFHWDGEFDTVRELLVARIAPISEVRAAATTRVMARATLARREKGSQELDFPVPVTAVPYYTPENIPGPITPSRDRLSEDGRYDEAFTATFGTTKPTTTQIVDAMDAYCASIRSTTNAFDRFRAGDRAAMSESALRGLVLFENRAGCAKCHSTTLETGRATFSDGRFHDTGVSTREEAAAIVVGKDGTAKPDLGRQETMFLKKHGRKFKTPTLRDVATHAPYMHDASFATLTDVVRYYSQGGTPHDGLDPAIKKLDLTDGEVADLVAFLESLTGASRAGLGFSSLDVKPLRVKIIGLDGKPLPKFDFVVSPFGDRLLGEKPARVATMVTTDADGVAEFSRPLSTHVTLASATHTIDLARPIPDSCSSRTLIAVPNGKIALRLRRNPSYPAFTEQIEVHPAKAEQVPPTYLLRRTATLSVNEVVYVGDATPGAKPGTVCRIRFGIDEYELTVADGGAMFEPLMLQR